MGLADLANVERRIVACRRCPRLRAHCAVVARTKRRAYVGETYWGKPVPSFGDPRARLLLVGLAPGAHGSNRTGRMFTGDASGDFLYPALFRAGFASKPQSMNASDGLRLRDCLITAAARCAPPKNKPSPQELRNCFTFLRAEFVLLPRVRVVVALGRVAHEATVRLLVAEGFSFESRARFAHGAEAVASKANRLVRLIASYHPSRQNTNTGTLTRQMFDAIFSRANDVLLERSATA